MCITPSIDVPDVVIDLGWPYHPPTTPTPPMPSHTSLHISLNVCHVTSHHPPHITRPPHPTPPHPRIPTHPYIYPLMFVMLLHTTHPTPLTPSHASLHISPNVCHVTSHHQPQPYLPMHPYTHPPMFVMLLHTTHPTHIFPHIPTHNPQCLSCYFTPPTPSHASLHISPMFVMLLHTTQAEKNLFLFIFSTAYSCAITSHPSVCDCCCWHCWCCQHCGQKLTSKLSAYGDWVQVELSSGWVILHFFQSFPTKVVQNDLECSILIISHFLPSFPTKVV